MPDLGYTQKRFGWIPDYPSIKDYTLDTPAVKKIVYANEPKFTASTDSSSNSSFTVKATTLPSEFDNSKYCSPIKDQGNIGSCTAFAAIGMYEYMEKKSYGKFISGSELFLYKVTRKLIHLTGDTGAYIRSAIGALQLFGVPPAEFYPYNEARFDEEPDIFSYQLGQSFQAIKYFKFDAGALMTDRKLLVNTIKDWINRGYVMNFGFTVYESYGDSATNGGCFPFPSQNEAVQGGHAVMIVGYNDNKSITNNRDNNTKVGAFKIRNSWGIQWGEAGYGWIPYDFFYAGLADDIWTMTRQEWVDTSRFNYEQ